MSKKVTLLVLLFCMIFSVRVHAADYNKQLNNTNSRIRTVRSLIKEDKKILRKLKRLKREFNKLTIDISQRQKYNKYLKKERTKTLNRIKIRRKKLKRLKKKRTKIKKILANSYCGVILQYDKVYNITTNKLTQSGGVCYYNGHRETFYSQRVLPGGGLRIPGRHVANDGTIRDKDGYIVVAANPSFYSRGTRLMISLGPAKVYDCGCAYGTIDVYVNW